ncbi:beta-agarase [Lutibacter citreus]|uniref:beta-agarase n=1 Tax=Lutibacter citreus TaxID=2138210 RepID=UPI000DBE9655|nr:beta-agarase [Lutibacter citreus]
MKFIQSVLKYLVLFLLSVTCFGQVNVNANLNVKHSVEGISTFDRSKFIVIHANQTEKEWDGDNLSSDLRNDFLNGYDVYLGRDTGGISWNLNNVTEDSTRPGFASPSEIKSKGLTNRNNFRKKTNLHQYEARKNATIAGQLHPFWTGEGQKATSKGWKLANGTATGEYMGRYVNEFYGGEGQKTPSYIEVINEPSYESLGGKLNYTGSIKEIADFHVEVANGIRAQAPNLKIGGYTTAFPDFEVGDFQRWNNRWKLFMDIAGEKMDFWSIHLYDFGSIRGGEKELRSGSNVEATFDMMEQYSKLSFNKVKPFVISEYGAQTHDYNNKPWSPYRDWLHIKASSSLLMSFLERPNSIASAINFLACKAEWGFKSKLNIPYASRLMRKENEPTSYTGKWVYTDMVKFFQLWKNVKGTRIDTTTDNLDIQVDAYVDGDKGYLIVNNLNFQAETINLNIFDSKNIAIKSILKKHLTLNGDVPVLEEETFNSSISEVEVGAESTLILEYTFKDDIIIDESSIETKYYATDYLKPIIANKAQSFNIINVSKSKYGEAVLRIGVGREHGKNLHPKVKVNNTVIEVPDNWRGYDQAQRERFFGVLEIPVPYNVLLKNNTVDVEFSDDGGHISSVTMQVFEFSSNIREVDASDIPRN